VTRRTSDKPAVVVTNSGADLDAAGEGRMNRRTFLGAAGTATAALTLAACGAGRSSTDAAVDRPRALTAPPARYHSRPDLRPPRVLVATRPSHPELDAFVFTDAHGGRGQQGPMIIDRAGDLVWFAPVSQTGSAGSRAMNVRVQTYRHQPVLTWWRGGLVASHGAGHYEIYDESYRRVAQVHAGYGYMGDLHEFRLTSRGTALLTAYAQATGEIPTPDGRSTRRAAYWYCVAQEVDVATGEVLLHWRSDHHVPFSASRRLPPPKDPSEPWDYFHMNSIAVDPRDDNLIISARNTWSCYKVDRSTGELLWTLGGEESDFKIGDDAGFVFQHDVIPRDNGTFTVFDNEAGPPAHAAQSRGLVIAVDEAAREVSFVRQFHHDPAVLTEALGNVQELEDGRTFIGWGQSSWFTEYDPAGDVVLDAQLSGGVLSYRAFQNLWRGLPADPPAVSAERHGAGTRVYASWNGSTVHRQWRVLGGARRGELTPMRLVPRRGFETTIELGGAPAWVVAEAIDEHGLVAGRSAPLRV
jgi:hypothetical protein